MHFTSGASRAFEKLMKSKPGFDHYDSGSDGEYEECRSCHYHRPGWSDRFCEHRECPYEPGRSTVRTKSRKGGDIRG